MWKMTKMAKKIVYRAPKHLSNSEAVARSGYLLVLPLAALLAAAIVVAGVGTTFALARKTVLVNLDGKTKTLYAWGDTVDDLLKENQLNVADSDKIQPSLDSELRNGMKIAILSSREVTVELNGQEASTNTTEPSVADAVKANWPDQPVTFKTTSGQDTQGNKLPLFAPGDQLQLAHDGKIEKISAKKGEETTDILQRANLGLGDKDKLKVVFNPGALPLIQIQRVSEEKVTSQETIPFTVETTSDNSKYKGEKTIIQKGVNGAKEIVKTVRKIDGQIESETVHSEKILAQAVAQKESIGTKTPPPPAETAAPAPVALGDDVWSKLAFCESGGRPGTNTGNGFYGMYQFTLPTWKAVGGSGLPSEASAEEQTKRAQILQARAGWGQWPACTRKLGLR